VDGLRGTRVANQPDLVCSGRTDRTAGTPAARTGISAAPTLAALVAAFHTLGVAIQPQHLDATDPRPCDWTAGRPVVSILAGKRLASLAKAFPRARNIVRTMPNTPGQIGAGITAWSARQALSAPDGDVLKTLLDALGESVE